MLYLDVACNDGDNGLFAGRAEMLSIGEAEFEQAFVGRSPAFTELDGAVRLSGKRWQVIESRQGVGNWCWNRYLLGRVGLTPRWYLVEFVTWLRARRLYRCTTGESAFYDWFNGTAEISPARVHTLLGGLDAA